MTTDNSLQLQIKKQKTMSVSSSSLKVFLRSAKAKAPTRGSPLSAGYDIYASEETVIPSKGQGLVSTDVSIIVPEGTYGRVAPRSGLAVKHGINCGAGVIDADYRGEVKVMLFNHGEKDFKIEAGDRIAQLILEKIVMADVAELNTEDWEKELNTERGEGGFGSTGKK